jgi:hypothetical protein
MNFNCSATINTPLLHASTRFMDNILHLLTARGSVDIRLPLLPYGLSCTVRASTANCILCFFTPSRAGNDGGDQFRNVCVTRNAIVYTYLLLFPFRDQALNWSLNEIKELVEEKVYNKQRQVAHLFFI